MHFMGKLGLEKVSKRSRRDPDHEKTFLTFTLSVSKIILYQFSMFKSWDSIASVVGIFMYLTISKLKQVLRSRKGLGKVSTTTLVNNIKWYCTLHSSTHLDNHWPVNKNNILVFCTLQKLHQWNSLRLCVFGYCGNRIPEIGNLWICMCDWRWGD